VRNMAEREALLISYARAVGETLAGILLGDRDITRRGTERVKTITRRLRRKGFISPDLYREIEDYLDSIKSLVDEEEWDEAKFEAMWILDLPFSFPSVRHVARH